MKTTYEVRDFRNKQFFMVDDAYLNGYAKLCGSNATLVYLCLCRHADKSQKSFPSIKSMAEKIGISVRSAIRGINNLIEYNIVAKERTRRQDATWLNNTYILLDKSQWKPKPSATVAHGSQVPNTTEPSATVASGSCVSQVPLWHTKETHKTKDTHKKDTHSKFDSIKAKMFDMLWNDYPKKLGKKASLRHYNASVKTKEDLQNITKAITNYLKYIKAENVIYKYMKHGATWFNNWQEWIDYKPEPESMFRS